MSKNAQPIMNTVENDTLNVDPDEIEKFSTMAEQWWDLEGAFKPLHLLNPTRLRYIEEGVNGLFAKKIIDVGCGGGILAESMALKDAHVVGIDMAEASLKIAKLHSLETKLSQSIDVNYQKIPVEQYAFENKELFDVVTCMEMLEHVPDPASIIQACCDLVKPGGTVYFSTINKTMKAYVMMILGAEHVLQWIPKGTHHYDKFIRPSTLLEAVDQTQLSCKDLCGIGFSPLSNSFKIINNVQVNYMLRCVKREN